MHRVPLILSLALVPTIALFPAQAQSQIAPFAPVPRQTAPLSAAQAPEASVPLLPATLLATGGFVLGGAAGNVLGYVTSGSGGAFWGTFIGGTAGSAALLSAVEDDVSFGTAAKASALGMLGAMVALGGFVSMTTTPGDGEPSDAAKVANVAVLSVSHGLFTALLARRWSRR